MARPSKEPPSPSSLVPALFRFVRARGVDPTPLAARFGFAADIESRDEAAIGATAAGELLGTIAESFGEPHLALHLPQELPHKRYGHAELAARASPTVRGALTVLARYGSLIFPQLDCALEEKDDVASWSTRIRGQPRGVGRQAHEYVLSYVIDQIRRETDVPIAPKSVWFVHARPPDLTALHRYFGTRDVSFGAENSGFSLDRAVLDLPLRAGDDRLLVTAEELADAALRAQPRIGQLSTVVATRVRALLPGDVSIDVIAKALHMSARTLQRRLDEEGVRFSELVDNAREAEARAAIEDHSLSLAEISYRLGFADLATFSRAFKRWTGQPPGAWRRR
jgi:AraC-like DNA-binding protein